VPRVSGEKVRIMPASSNGDPPPERRQPEAELEPEGLVPQTPIVSKRTYAAPMSYVGSARRVAAVVRRKGPANPGVAAVAWGLGLLAILLLWVVVTGWYGVALLLFGVFMIPYRFMRRSARRQDHLQQVQLATMQAMMVNQQRALSEKKRPHKEP
jgi:Flp pilus assembly protein TadB